MAGTAWQRLVQKDWGEFDGLKKIGIAHGIITMRTQGQTRPQHLHTYFPRPRYADAKLTSAAYFAS